MPDAYTTTTTVAPIINSEFIGRQFISQLRNATFLPGLCHTKALDGLATKVYTIPILPAPSAFTDMTEATTTLTWESFTPTEVSAVAPGVVGKAMGESWMAGQTNILGPDGLTNLIVSESMAKLAEGIETDLSALFTGGSATASGSTGVAYGQTAFLSLVLTARVGKFVNSRNGVGRMVWVGHPKAYQELVNELITSGQTINASGWVNGAVNGLLANQPAPVWSWMGFDFYTTDLLSKINGDVDWCGGAFPIFPDRGNPDCPVVLTTLGQIRRELETEPLKDTWGVIIKFCYGVKRSIDNRISQIVSVVA